MTKRVNGLPLVVGAYLFWGAYPIYLKALKAVSPFEIMAHRVVWASVAMVCYVLVSGRRKAILRTLGNPRALLICTGSAALLSSNWVVYAAAVNAGHLGETSLGNFVNPLLSMLLGAWLFKERLTRLQMMAFAIALIGVAVYTLAFGKPPWIGLFLAGTFALYGALRKMVSIGPIEGLALETVILLPIALAYLCWLYVSNTMRFGHEPMLVNAMLVGIGPVSAIPLTLFAVGATRIRLTTLGLVQFLSPSVQFFLAFCWYKEPLSAMQMAGFCIIWCALIVYAGQAIWLGRGARARPVMHESV